MNIKSPSEHSGNAASIYDRVSELEHWLPGSAELRIGEREILEAQ
jgi:hypothetical protein